MEINFSLQCSQEPTTGPSPGLDESSPHPYTLFLWGPEHEATQSPSSI